MKRMREGERERKEVKRMREEGELTDIQVLIFCRGRHLRLSLN